MDPNNMIFRLEDLTVEKVYEEYGISEERRKENPGLYKMFIEDFIPTREDLDREIDEESLKQLCLRLPCRVLMYRWNPVQDFVDQFTRQGRIQRWAKDKTQKLLVKAVRRHKDVCLYRKYDIRKQREREWCERKKDNLMRLKVWEYDQNSKDINVSSEEESYKACNIVNSDDRDVVPGEMLGDHAIATSIMDIENVMAELHGTPIELTLSDGPIQPLSQNTQSKDLRTQNTEELADREYVEMVLPMSGNSAPPLADYVNVNTESMVIEDSTTISQDVLDSAECTPPYCEFTELLSVTSTQTPTPK